MELTRSYRGKLGDSASLSGQSKEQEFALGDNYSCSKNSEKKIPRARDSSGKQFKLKTVRVIIR